MRINRETDYALRIMRVLAMHGDLTDAKTISHDICVPMSFTLKILRKLSVNGLILSRKGVNGGYRLNGSPEDINLRRIVGAIEGPMNIASCLKEGYVCEHQNNDPGDGNCYFNRLFGEINNYISDKLESITLKDVIDG